MTKIIFDHLPPFDLPPGAELSPELKGTTMKCNKCGRNKITVQSETKTVDGFYTSTGQQEYCHYCDEPPLTVLITEAKDSMKDLHIVPGNDLKEHDTSVETGGQCHCKPITETVGARLIIIHNAYDDRETIENIEEFLQNSRGE